MNRSVPKKSIYFKVIFICSRQKKIKKERKKEKNETGHR